MTDQQLARIEEILWHDCPSRDIWMIVDGARTVEVFRMLLECHLEYSCLYSGSLTSELEMAAPYLVQLEPDYRDTHRLIRQAWGNSWGVFSPERHLSQEPPAASERIFGGAGFQRQSSGFPLLRSARIAGLLADLRYRGVADRIRSDRRLLDGV